VSDARLVNPPVKPEIGRAGGTDDYNIGLLRRTCAPVVTLMNI
jgi:hypothetical protein